jgi:DNA-binding IclR family transcriptional regulator
LSRVFEVMRAIAAAPAPLTSAEISTAVGVPVSSTYELLQTLADLQLVESAERRFSLGPAAFTLAAQLLDGVSVRRRARPFLESLAEQTGQAVYLAVPSGDQLVYLDRCFGANPVRIQIRLGQPLFLHCTAVGKLFAAYDSRFHARLMSGPRPALTPRSLTTETALTTELSRIRRRGVSVTRGESFLGILGIAVPVWDADSSLAAALHVSCPQASVDAAHLRQLIEQAQTVSGELSAAIGGLVPLGADTAPTRRRRTG